MITRFAPSPTGPLHLGHAYSAILAHDRAMQAGGTFLLRIDDLDQTRARPEWEAQLKDDLRWLGLWWPEPCRRESEHMAEYEAALDRLWEMGLLYPCTCTRRDIREALSAPQEGIPVEGPDGLVYPGTCRARWSMEQTFPEDHPRPQGVTLRLDMDNATRLAPAFTHRIETRDGGWHHVASFTETGSGQREESGLVEFTSQEMIDTIGDVVLARRDFGAAYHLAVVVDDAAQDVTHVIRGRDLFEATKIHVLLQSLLGLPRPVYHHHRLIRDDAGKRLAKRDDARAIATYRAEGATPADIRRLVGL
ncbi:tRNA glutamyl-Q(34) synthetase GluQRS [Thetidibacter halocola]|uniref:tRNA glutamyl-Q(34) synthetase GluQRS n=1 Tax=Thetidibacter halocola TaxID=2827239 RepID=A0A8J7WA10_9RHOB|nr:tRNA glutamyl-Q(34) synthetase GluQRS [Thetidibacter halocola]MBS0122967.1 tRNA glutamyl-Q(34) synthetase GluQRS [Thetidibacter halocola]